MTEPALQIHITDPELQAYLQRYPFASGPDPAKNAAGRKAVMESFLERPEAPEVRPERIALESAGLPEGEQAAADTLLRRINVNDAMRAVYRNDFAWEANLIPREARNVLAIGCGDGIELIYLRAILPEARITGIDYHRSLLQGLAEAVGMTFLDGDMNRHLLLLKQEYDLVFSNHTLEHLFDPDPVLGMLASLLVSGGHLVSILPMVACEGTPYLESTRKLARSRSIHPVEMSLIDAGHPWKTNPGDLTQTLERAGFRDVKLYQREWHISRPLKRPAAAYERSRGVMTALNALVVRPLRVGMKLLFPRSIPDRLAALLFAFERRVPFGTNRSMNMYSEEAFVIGCRLD